VFADCNSTAEVFEESFKE